MSGGEDDAFCSPVLEVRRSRWLPVAIRSTRQRDLKQGTRR
uniref:Uncharacterized protein n=1 Tax=Arundo donax TaxID=35708 RepID=A0A0A8ZDR5_ARUDO